jgi:hypothetical protein
MHVPQASAWPQPSNAVPHDTPRSAHVLGTQPAPVEPPEPAVPEPAVPEPPLPEPPPPEPPVPVVAAAPEPPVPVVAAALVVAAWVEGAPPAPAAVAPLKTCWPQLAAATRAAIEQAARKYFIEGMIYPRPSRRDGDDFEEGRLFFTHAGPGQGGVWMSELLGL